MKIVLDARFWRKSTGGIGRYTRELIKALLALKTKDEFHILITPLDVADFDIKDKRVVKHVIDIPHYSWKEQTQLASYIYKINPDITHFLNFNQPMLFRGKRITTIHDLTLKYFPMGRSRTNWFRLAALNLSFWRAAHSDVVIVPTRATKKDVIQNFHVDPQKVLLVYEAAGEEFKPRNKKQIEAFCQKKKLRKYILFVSQLRPHKGLPDLITSFNKLRSTTKLTHQLVVVGPHFFEFPQIWKAIKQSPFRKDIVITGFVSDEDLLLYYAGAEALIFPSYYEGFGLGALEAMKSGKPVIATDNTSLPEVCGDAALYFQPGDTSRLTFLMKKLLSSAQLRKKLAQRGLKQAKKFSWDKMARETYEIYKKVSRK